jgi:AraC-like DNA-binding protein
MSETFWKIVFAVGAAQGVFLCGALLLRRAKNRAAARLLAVIVGVATTMIVAGAATAALPSPFDGLLVFLNINTELALGPLLLLFAHSLLDPDRRLSRRDGLHFLPLALGMIAWGSAWAALGEVGRREAFLDHHLTVPLYMLFKVGWLFSYIAVTYRALRCDSRISRLHAVGRRPVDLAWLRHGLLVLAGMAGLIYVNDFAGRFGLKQPIQADPFGSLVLAVMIYMVSLMVLQRPWILALRLRPVAANGWNGEVARLTALLERERPWRRPDLSLRDLGRALGSSDNRLSTVIQEGLGTSFYALVSRYRLAEFERLARDPGLRHRSVLDLAYEAGFNSKASFYRVFRESHGTTPTAFRRAI